MKALIVSVAVSLLVSGCGWVEHFGGAISGGGYETCVDGVLYLQFTSGATVKYLPDGKIATCK